MNEEAENIDNLSILHKTVVAFLKEDGMVVYHFYQISPFHIATDEISTRQYRSELCANFLNEEAYQLTRQIQISPTHPSIVNERHVYAMNLLLF